MCLCNPELPRRSGVLDGFERRRTGATVETRHEDGVGLRLGHAHRNRSDTRLGHELHRHAAVGFERLEVVDELSEILDRIDVVVRRRRDQRDARFGVPEPGDLLCDLVTGKLSSLAGLGSLRHLDLEFLRRGQISGSHAEPAGRDLLDGRVPYRPEPQLILPALSGVRETADVVHRLGERDMSFGRERPERHRCGDEPSHDRLHRLDLVDRDRASIDERQQVPDLRRRTVLDRFDVGGPILHLTGSDRSLQTEHDFGRGHVIGAAATLFVEATDELFAFLEIPMQCQDALGELGEAKAVHPRRGVAERQPEYVGMQADRFEELRASIRGHRADAHLRHDLEHAAHERRPVVLLRDDRVEFDDATLGELTNLVDGEVGVDRRCPVPEQRCEIVAVTHLPGHGDDRGLEANALADQMMMDRADGQQHRHRCV